MSKTAKRNLILLVGIMLLRFCGDSFFYGFLTRYFDILDGAAHNFGDVRLGVLLSIIPFMAVIGNTVLSKIATSMKKNIVILLIWTAIESTFIMASGFCTEYWFVLAYDIICCFCSNSFYNLLDTFIMPISKKAGKTYAFGRSFGTIAYVIGTFFGGMIIDSIGYKWTFFIGGAMMLGAGIIFLFIKFEDMEKEDEQETDKPATYKEVLSNRNFIFYGIFIAVLLGITWGSDNVYNLYSGSKYAGSLNISNELFGYFYAATDACEALMLFIFSRIKKAKTLKVLMFVATFAMIVRLVMFAIPGMNQYVYLAAQMLRGFTYGIVLTCDLNLFQNILGKRLMYKGFFLAIAFDELVAAIIDLAAPSVISATNYTTEFLILAGLMVVDVVFLALVKLNPEPGETIKPSLKEENEENLSQTAN